MTILRQLAWMAFKKAAANPRVQRKAVDTARAIDRGMDRAADKTVEAVEGVKLPGETKNALKNADEKMSRAADKVVEVATADDPAREMGRALGKLFSDK